MPQALPFTPFLRDPTLRATAWLLVLWGAVVCAFGPYTSVLAVETFGLGDRGYAALLVVSSLLSVTAALWVGIRADQTANRRRMALSSVAILLAGLALVSVAPSPATFVVMHAVLLPVSGTLWGQLFALARLAASTHPPADRDGILAALRGLFALPFVIVMPIWAYAFAKGASLLAIYPVTFGITLAMMALMLWRWPQDGKTAWADAPSGLSFRRALAELATPGTAARLVALGAINGAATIYMAILALVMVPAVGRGPADVALYFGLVAGLEVPFMFALPLISGRLSRTWLLLLGTTAYCVQLVLLPVLAGHWTVWLLVLPAATGGAAMLTIPIAYLQDLLSSRPGTGAALMALQTLTGQVIAAACFALGTTWASYGLVAALSGGIAVCGAVLLHLADTRAARQVLAP